MVRCPATFVCQSWPLMASSAYQNTRQSHSGHSIPVPFGSRRTRSRARGSPEVRALLAVDLAGGDAAGLEPRHRQPAAHRRARDPPVDHDQEDGEGHPDGPKVIPAGPRGLGGWR
jgi:hypothetical protein